MDTTTEAPLTNYRIVGMVERVHQACPGAPVQPGGSCWHCGTGIKVCVVIKHTTTGEVHEIGTTCAERVGLDKAQLKALLAERFAEQRAEARRIRSAEYRREIEEREARETAEHGAHGIESRYVFGCRCDPCIAGAPHGTWHRFQIGKCSCLDCIDAFLELDAAHSVREVPVMVRLSDGAQVDARRVDTKFGYRWCVENGNRWLPVKPVRRSTQAKHGYVESVAPFIVDRIKTREGGTWYKPIRQVGSPVLDAWGEVLPRAEAV